MKVKHSTKSTIFEVATSLFAQEGYHNVSMRQIAEAVGIQPSSIYSHYESKDAILEEIYEYFGSNMERHKPHLYNLLEQVGQRPVREILRGTSFTYPEAIRPLLSKAMLVAASMLRVDERADKLISKYMIEMAFEYDVPLLKKMLEMNLIEPLDTKAFALLHSNYSYAAAVRFYTNHSISTEDWYAGLEMLFDLIKEK